MKQVLVAAAAAAAVLHHRVTDPSLPVLPFLKRADVALAQTNPADFAATVLQDDVDTFVDLLKDSADLSSAYYQVALETPTKSDQSDWAFSTVKACHLQNADSQTFVFYLSADSEPYAIDYFVSPINHNGSCPTPQLTSAEIMPRLQRLNTTFLFRGPSAPPLPELRAPPQLSPEGEVVQPIPEKTFLQKYWIYMAALAVVVLFGGGAPEEGSGQGGEGGGGGGGGR